MKRWWEPWLLLAPFLIHFIVFTAFPIVMSFLGTVMDFGYYGEGWIGFKAYVSVFTAPRFWMSVWVTLKFVIILLPTSIFLMILTGVIVGWAAQKLQAVIRAVYFIPAIAPALMISFSWRWLVSPGGPLGWFIGDTLMLGSNPYAFWTIAVMVLSTSVGGSLVYFAAALAAIDSQLYEAAELDGCNRRQLAWHITIPLAAPIILFMSVQRLSGLLQTWLFPYAMTGGGPNYATTTIMLNIYQTGLASSRVPQGAVMSLFLLVLTIGLILIYRWISGRKILF